MITLKLDNQEVISPLSEQPDGTSNSKSPLRVKAGKNRSRATTCQPLAGRGERESRARVT
jgi:hypothetical protein